jgi:hypothetical protein
LVLCDAKKKLTDDELFAYDLCRDLKIWHPDYLECVLTWDQFRGWQKAFAQRPWGDERADFRAAANSLWNHASGSDAPNLTWPYMNDAEEMWEKHKELERHADDPAIAEKLKLARQKHMEEKRKREGK